MDWRTELKRLGHDKDGAMVGLLEWFEKNPKERLSTNQMGQLGLRWWRKGRREWSMFNQATVERKARELRDIGLLNSYTEGGYVYFELPNGLTQAPTASQTLREVWEDGKLVRMEYA